MGLLSALAQVFDSIRDVMTAGGQLRLVLSTRLGRDEEARVKERGVGGEREGGALDGADDGNVLRWVSDERLVLDSGDDDDIVSELSRWCYGWVYVFERQSTVVERRREEKEREDRRVLERLRKVNEDVARERERLREEEKQRMSSSSTVSSHRAINSNGSNSQPHPTVVPRQLTRHRGASDAQGAHVEEVRNRARAYAAFQRDNKNTSRGSSSAAAPAQQRIEAQ